MKRLKIALLAFYVLGLLAILLVAVALSSQAPAAQPVPQPLVITITIPAATRDRAATAFEEIYPIPQIADPKWIDPGDGTQAPMVNQYTSDEWLEVRMRKWLRDTIARAEQSAAKRAVKFTPDVKVVPKLKAKAIP